MRKGAIANLVRGQRTGFGNFYCYCFHKMWCFEKITDRFYVKSKLEHAHMIHHVIVLGSSNSLALWVFCTILFPFLMLMITTKTLVKDICINKWMLIIHVIYSKLFLLILRITIWNQPIVQYTVPKDADPALCQYP